MITKEAIEAATEELLRHGEFGTSMEASRRYAGVAAKAALNAGFAAMPAEREIDEGRFEQWTLADFAGQCRMQARDNLDPEYSQFMAALAARLSALAAMPGPAVKVKQDSQRQKDGVK